MLKVGVFGTGHLGKFHLNNWKEIEGVKLVGFYEPVEQTAKEVTEKYGLKRYTDADKFIEACDAVDIVAPTNHHFYLCEKAIRKGKHVFVEKPMANTIEEGRLLVNMAREANIKMQVGHVERFNPAFIAAKPYIDSPMFIEVHRLAQFNPRGIDVPVVLDLMIHDLDIILSVVNSSIKRVSASGIPVISDSPDIANVRLEFDNGCVANITASRISMKNMRKARFFQRNAYISVDFLNKSAEIVEIKDLEGEPGPFSLIIDNEFIKNKKELKIIKPNIIPINAIKTELYEFYKSIENNYIPPVSLADGVNALTLAHQIIEKISY